MSEDPALPVETPPVPVWQHVSETLPPDGTWCWVWDGLRVMLAVRERMAAGGWGNGDTWEDFGKLVTHWYAIDEPLPPPEQVLRRDHHNRLGAIAQWLQQEDDELLYTPDAAEMPGVGIPGRPHELVALQGARVLGGYSVDAEFANILREALAEERPLPARASAP